MNTADVKRLALDLGADLCGIASIDRFSDAPEGFHPSDVMPSCRSVVALAKAFPVGTLHAATKVPYTITRNMLSDILDKLTVELCIRLEKQGIAALPTGAISHNQFDPKTGRMRAIVSAKHCAAAAGLGRIGKNTLLVTPQYGNMVWLGVVLTDAELAPDDVLTGNPCPSGCTWCADHCPASALGNPMMNQSACYAHAFHTEPGQEFVFKCHLCRTGCPNCLGTRNKLQAG